MVSQDTKVDVPVSRETCNLDLDTGSHPAISALSRYNLPSFKEARILEGRHGEDLPLRQTGGVEGKREYSKFHLKHLQKLGLRDDSYNISPEESVGAIIDFPLCEVKRSCTNGGSHKEFAEWALRSVARSFRRLMENLAVSLSDRCKAIMSYLQPNGEDIAKGGFYFVDPLQSVMKRFKDGGAAFIGIWDKKYQVRGGIAVDVDPSTLFKDDQKLIDEFKATEYYDPEKTYSVLYAAGIDPDISKPVAEGGFGVSRGELYKCLHALAIDKVRNKSPEVTHLISCVRGFPCANPAAEAHAEIGWNELPGLINRIPHFIKMLGKTALVEHQLLELDVWSSLQTEIIDWARGWLDKHPQIPFRFYTSDEGPDKPRTIPMPPKGPKELRLAA